MTSTSDPTSAASPTDRPAPAASVRLGVKDIVTIAICAVIAMVFSTVIGMLLSPIYGFAYPLVGPICTLFMAPLWVLATYRAPKRGAALLFFLVVALINALPGYWYMLPYFIVGGLICEAILWRRGSYRDTPRNCLAFAIFGAMNSVGTFLPIWLFGPDYYDRLGMGETGTLFAGYAFSPIAVAGGVVAGIVLAVLGHWAGRRLLTRHFIKAGIVPR